MSLIHFETGWCSVMSLHPCRSGCCSEKVSARLMLAGHAAQIIGLAGMFVLFFLNK